MCVGKCLRQDSRVSDVLTKSVLGRSMAEDMYDIKIMNGLVVVSVGCMRYTSMTTWRDRGSEMKHQYQY